MKKWYWIITLILGTLFLTGYIIWIIVTILTSSLPLNILVIVAIAILFTVAVAIVFSFWFTRSLLKKKFYINKSFYKYLDTVVSINDLGLLILSPDSKIVWVSDFATTSLGSNLIDKSVTQIFPEWSFNDNNSDEIIISRKIGKNSVTKNYKVRKYIEYNIITIQDITLQESIIKNYKDEKIAIAEMEIDNYQLYQSTTSEEEIFAIETIVVDMLENLSKEYNLAYKQYVKGKFILITNNQTIEKMIESGFKFVETIDNNNKLKSGLRLTVSMGIAKGQYKINELFEISKQALRQSQSRGGDQITIYEKDTKPIFFGSKSEIAIDYSRTAIREIAQSLESKLVSKAIKKVIIYGHKLSDLDALGSAYALSQLAIQLGKKEVYIQNVTYDNTTKAALERYLPKSNLFIKPSSANQISDSSTLVIIVDTAEKNRIENPEAFDKIKPENIFIFDHHRLSQNIEFAPLKNQYVQTTASSASEIVTEVLSFIEHDFKFTPMMAQLLLNGIYMDTNQFQKSTSAQTFNAAAILEFRGASAAESVELLKVTEEINNVVKKLLLDTQEVKKGFFITYSEAEVPEDVVSITADEMLRIRGRKAAFVVAKIPNSTPTKYKMSARGIKTNVQIIAEAVGGGGHYGAAAATSDENLSDFVDNIKQAIVSVKENESNNY
ncbi:c-di-AMP phosphodiesterase-like protein [Mycoplasma testudineum]|uniref:C-di-AMP phosphodiesterase-like protein n=1 Tax=Mycoplasma testudineum TaxID=244584 RepID=A0A4R6IG57_9MOLU|nr:DHH family phosphoesterase [Mycoplasma testudineum]OYD27115.1 hypothetical protein CG473_00525 [Mycoplasma testudineum]TDO21132.1 c-di-AMP phosphodiesterase-like protein [Mycoplasma testudineum]